MTYTEVNLYTPISQNGFPRELDIYVLASRKRVQLATSNEVKNKLKKRTITYGAQVENQFWREVTPFLKSAHKCPKRHLPDTFIYKL